ncbi:type II secretion system F family protein [Thiobacter aerophilum]|uniref:Type II secretion system F family protein n=1 Tax=Thiobacter aerophilum TaxID=3121275 RepID=A0ABV0EGJ5_9BURK
MAAAATSSLIVAGVGLLTGLSVGLVGWQLSRAVVEVPPEDRTYLDPPPPAFRLLWWPIQWVAYYLGPLLPLRQRQRLLVQLRLAGLDYALSPEQLIAQRLLASLLGGLLLWWIAGSFRAANSLGFGLLGALLGYALMHAWFRDRIALRRRETLKTLPFFLDLITLCVEAGLNLTGAFQQAVAKGPAGPLRDELKRVLRDIRAGKPRVDALRTFADRLNEPAVASLVSALIQGEAMGMNLGPILRAQAEQRRVERFVRAEKAAMEAPVKLLFPLIFFIFPCTFLILLFPIIVRFLQMGL